jgi:hypothetical protein
MIALAIALVCASCSGSFDFPQRPEVIAAPVDNTPTLARTCFVRARLFRGFVPINCADLALEGRP